MLHVCDNVLTELPRLHIRGAVVKSRPDARFDNLLQWLRKALEVPRLTIEAAAGNVERDFIGAEERLQNLQVRTIKREVPGRVLGIRRDNERRP